MKVSIKSIEEYNTVYFDMDFTIWFGCRPEFWAKRLVNTSTWELSNNRIYNMHGDFIELGFGIHMFLTYLKSRGITLKTITRGGIPGVKYEDQPPYIALSMFRLIPFFNEIIILEKDDKKINHMNKNGKTVLIDDMIIDMDDTTNSSKGIDIIDRNEFKEWITLLD